MRKNASELSLFIQVFDLLINLASLKVGLIGRLATCPTQQTSPSIFTLFFKFSLGIDHASIHTFSRSYPNSM